MDDVVIIQLPGSRGRAMGLMYRLFWEFTFTTIYCNLNLQGNFNVIEGGIKLWGLIRFWYSGSMSVRTYVRTDILLLERGAMLGYLILLPLVLMLKVLNDGAYMSYVLPRGMRHVHMMHVTCLISF